METLTNRSSSLYFDEEKAEELCQYVEISEYSLYFYAGSNIIKVTEYITEIK